MKQGSKMRKIRTIPPSLSLAAAMMLAAGLMGSAAWSAGLFPAGTPSDAKAPIEILSDRLVANNAEKWADFLGAVTATQGRFSMTSDALRIHYEGDLMSPPKGKSAQSQITKLVATGRVHIATDQYTADAERAEYVPATDVLTLSGENARLISGKNTLTGSKIVLNRSEGKALVESSGAERVKAVFFQEEKAAGSTSEKTEEKKP
jgi:lipopolysaccharide export system protein LptA